MNEVTDPNVVLDAAQAFLKANLMRLCQELILIEGQASEPEYRAFTFRQFESMLPKLESSVVHSMAVSMIKDAALQRLVEDHIRRNHARKLRETDE